MQYNQPYGAATNAPFVNGNPSIGLAGSIPPAASIEFPQREIVNFVTLSGLTPSNADLNQLSEAVQSGQVVYGNDTGNPNAVIVTLNPAPPAILPGFTVIAKIANNNLGASTLRVNGYSPVPVIHPDGTALASLDLKVGALEAFVFDGTNYQLAWQTSSGGPKYLQTNTTYYTNGTTGSDTLYDGTSATVVGGTSHGPFATIQKGVNQIPLFNLNGFAFTLNVANGSYAPFSVPPINGPGNVFLTGNTGSPSSVTVTGVNQSSILIARIGGTLTLDGFTVTCSGAAAGDGICGVNIIGAGTVVVLGHMVFGTCVGSQLSVQGGALVSNLSASVPWTITGGCIGNVYEQGCFLFAYSGGQVINNSAGGPSITLSTSITYAGYFVLAAFNSFTQFVPTGILGPGSVVSGTKFFVSQNSEISTGGQALSFYPGPTAGIQQTTTGGFYS